MVWCAHVNATIKRVIKQVLSGLPAEHMLLHLWCYRSARISCNAVLFMCNFNTFHQT